MKVGILADAHGNIDAVRLALGRMNGDVERILMVGDAIDHYRFSNEMIELIRETGMTYIVGNHETAILGPYGERARSAPHVKQELLAFLKTVPVRIELDLDGKRLLMVHGSPWPPYDNYVYPGSALLPQFAELGFDYVTMGHTHVQMATQIGSTLIINPGSIGDARDPFNGRLLSYAVLDTVADEVFFESFEDPTLAPILPIRDESFG